MCERVEYPWSLTVSNSKSSMRDITLTSISTKNFLHFDVRVSGFMKSTINNFIIIELIILRPVLTIYTLSSRSYLHWCRFYLSKIFYSHFFAFLIVIHKKYQINLRMKIIKHYFAPFSGFSHKYNFIPSILQLQKVQKQIILL